MGALSGTETRLQQAEHELQEEKQRHADTVAALRTSDGDLLAGRTRLLETQVQLKETQTQLKKIQAQFEETQADLEKSHARVRDMEALLSETRTQLQETQTRLSTAEAELGQQQAALNDAELSATVVRVGSMREGGRHIRTVIYLFIYHVDVICRNDEPNDSCRRTS